MTRPALQGSAEPRIGTCAACGKREHIALLDAKPEPGADPDATDWTRLECVLCYGPGYVVEQDQIKHSIRPELAQVYALIAKLDTDRERGWARAGKYKSQIARKDAALRPFASLGLDGDPADGDLLLDLMRDRICDWLGVSDFERARAALQPKEPPVPETADA